MDGGNRELLGLGIEAKRGGRQENGEQKRVDAVRDLGDGNIAELEKAKGEELANIGAVAYPFGDEGYGERGNEPAHDALDEKCPRHACQMASENRKGKGSRTECDFAEQVAQSQTRKSQIALQKCVGNNGKNAEGDCKKRDEQGDGWERKLRADGVGKEDANGGHACGDGDEQRKNASPHSVGDIFFFDECRAKPEVDKSNDEVDERHEDGGKPYLRR